MLDGTDAGADGRVRIGGRVTRETQQALIGGANALAVTALESFLRSIRCVHSGFFCTAASSLNIAEERADQALALDELWRASLKRMAS